MFKSVGKKLWCAAVSGACRRKSASVKGNNFIQADFFSVKAGKGVEVKNFMKGLGGKLCAGLYKFFFAGIYALCKPVDFQVILGKGFFYKVW